MNSIDLTPNLSIAIFGLVESIDKLTDILTRFGFWLLFCFAAFALLFLYKHLTGSRKKDSEKRFDPNTAEQLFLKGSIEELFAYCDEHIRKFPNDVWISWYCALGHFNRGNPDEAKIWFEKVSQINPGFRSEIEPYLVAIDSASSNQPKH